jgi:uncharacterized protein (TIGR02594 family)
MRLQLRVFRRPLRVVSFGFVAAVLCSAAMIMSASPASAKSRHGTARHHAHYARRQVARRHFAYRGYRHVRRAARWSHRDAGVAHMSAEGFAHAKAKLVASDSFADPSSSGGFGLSQVVADARHYIGNGNPTGLASLWCARFMNMVLHQAGYHGTGSDAARSFASYGRRVSGPRVGAIAVMARRGGGHVGVVSGIDAKGNPIVISGNYGHRVAEASISRGRIYAYVMPTG